MEVKQVFPFILFHLMINIVVFVVEGNSRSWRSAYFLTQENKRLPDNVAERFKSPSLISCSQSCLQNAWCSSANFLMSSKPVNGKGTCELNKHERSHFDANSKLHDQQGVIFTMILKVIFKHKFSCSHRVKITRVDLCLISWGNTGCIRECFSRVVPSLSEAGNSTCLPPVIL